MVSGRTLDIQGEKRVQALALRPDATRHSYTIQPVIRADGLLHSPMLVCMYEPKGEPNIFMQQLGQFDNLDFVSTTSGMLNRDLVATWLEKFLAKIDEGSLLLVDSWGGYKKGIDEHAKNHKFEIIPPKTTGKVQPLDVFFNRQWKSFVRILSDKIRRTHKECIVSQRINLGRLISLTHFQFSAPRFIPFIQYAWHAAGYTKEKPQQFLTPPQYCLNFDVYEKCACNSLGFIKCAYCENIICFDHAFMEQHRCQK